MSTQETFSKPIGFAPRSPEFRANPYPVYDTLRRDQPFYFRPEHKDWLISRHADVSVVLKSPHFGRSPMHADGPPKAESQDLLDQLLHRRQESLHLLKLWVILQNPPDHNRLRRFFSPTFKHSNMRSLKETIQAKANALLDQFESQAQLDLVQDYALPLALEVNCCHILGIPPQDWPPHFQKRSEDLAGLTDMDPLPLSVERGVLAIQAFAKYFKEWVAKCRKSSLSPENLIHNLIAAQDQGAITEDELIANCIMMLAVGHSAVANLIGLGVHTLLKHPEQLKKLQGPPSFIESTINEVLRYESPVQVISRTAHSDFTMGSVVIRENEVVHCLVGAAQRDPEHYNSPETFDIARAPQPLLCFGQGLHTCIGKHLATMTAQIAIDTLIRRFENISLSPHPLEWHDSFLVRGLKTLPIFFWSTVPHAHHDRHGGRHSDS